MLVLLHSSSMGTTEEFKIQHLTEEGEKEGSKQKMELQELFN